MANAKFEWTPPGGSRQSYTVPVNFTYDYRELMVDDSDRERAIDGTLRSYARGLKGRWILTFRHIPTSQKAQLAAIKAAQTEVDFYRDGDGPLTLRGMWTNDLDFREVAPGYWSGSIVLEEL